MTRLRMERLDSRVMPSIAFKFDYSFDTTGFFNSPARRAALEQAGFAITSQLNDTLTAITPGGGNTLTLTLTDPITNQTRTISNPTIGTDEIRVYVTAGNLPGDHLAATGSTRFQANGSTAFVNNVVNRGQSTAITESSPWGGILAFDSATSWYAFEGTLDPHEYDMMSVAQHELMHILGFGTGNPEFSQFVSGGQYRGPNVNAVNGGPIAIEADEGQGNRPEHWAAGTRSFGAPPIMLADLPAGTSRAVTAIDLAALADLGWSVDLITSAITSPPAGQAFGPIVGYSNIGDPLYSISQPPSPMVPVAPPSYSSKPTVVAVGADAGQAPTVTGYDIDGKVTWVKTVFASQITAGVRVALADFNNDGTNDLVVGTGGGTASQVRVLDGRTNAELFSIRPFESRFTGGVYVAAGDVTGDGRADLAIAAGDLGGPRVRVFGGATLAPLADFFAIEDSNFRGGTRPVLADFTGDGRADLVVAAGFGGGPRIAAYDGASLGASAPRKFVNDFFGGDVGTSDGAYIAAGQTNRDGVPDLVVSAGPTVTVYDGAKLKSRQVTANATLRPSTANSRSGARIALADVSGDGLADVLTFSTAAPSRVAAYSPLTRQLLGYEL